MTVIVTAALAHRHEIECTSSMFEYGGEKNRPFPACLARMQWLVPCAIASMLVACAATNPATSAKRAGPTNRAWGSVAGHRWSGELVAAEFCEHCAGGPMLNVFFGVPAHEGGVRLRIETKGCFPFSGELSQPYPEEVSVSVYDPTSRRNLQVLRQRFDLFECNRDQARASFHLELEDGGVIDGRIDTPLTFSVGSS